MLLHAICPAIENDRTRSPETTRFPASSLDPTNAAAHDAQEDMSQNPAAASPVRRHVRASDWCEERTRETGFQHCETCRRRFKTELSLRRSQSGGNSDPW